MSTYLSQVAPKSEYISGVPLDLIMQVGMYKQQKYDQNQAQLQGQLDQMASYELMKDEDRQYSKQRIQEVTNKMNEFSGYDLSDRKVFNQLKGYTSNLYADNKLYTGIVNTRRVRAEINKLNEIQEKHPELYSKDNYDDFMMGVNEWMSDGKAGTKYEGNGYQPYYDYNKSYSDIAKEIAKNPDIQRQILYNNDGSMRGDREVKQVTQQKIMEALYNSGDQRAIQQMDLEWRVNHKRGNFGVENARRELDTSIRSYDNNIKELQEQISSGKLSASDVTQAQQMIKSQQSQKEGLAQKLKEVNQTGDSTRYYTRGKYIQDRINGIAKGYAYEQVGKLDYDDLFLENTKFNHDKELAEFKSNLDIQEDMRRKELGLGKKGSTTDGDVAGDIVNPFEIEVGNVWINGEGQISNDRMRHIYGDGKDLDKDGNFNISNDKGSEVFLDLIPTLKELKIDVDNAKASAYANITTAYKLWTDKPEGQGIVIVNQTETDANGNTYEAPTRKKGPKSFQQYLATEQGKSLAATIKESTKFDINNATDIANVNKFINSPKAQELLTIGAKLQKLGKGNFKVKAGSDNNAFVGNNGQLYGKMNTILSEDELKVMDLDGDDLVEKGLVQKTSITNDKGEVKEVYMVPMTKKATKDLSVANLDFITANASSDDGYKKNKDKFKESFQQLTRDMIDYKAYQPSSANFGSPEMKDFWTRNIKPQGITGDAANKNYEQWSRSKEAIVAEAKIALEKYRIRTGDIERYQKGINTISQAAPVIMSKSEVTEKMNAYQNLFALIQATSIQ